MTEFSRFGYESAIGRSALMAQRKSDEKAVAEDPTNSFPPEIMRRAAIMDSHLPPQDVEDIKFVHEGGYGKASPLVKEATYQVALRYPGFTVFNRSGNSLGLFRPARQIMYPRQLGSPGE